MGIFLTYVLVNGDPKTAEAEATKLMGAYDKALQVAEYNGQCPCVHAQVAPKALELANTRVQIADAPTGGSQQERNQSVFERVAQTALALQEAQRAAIQELLDKAEPDPHCKDCGGSGTIKTTANPNGKWTSWQIGSRFEPGFVLEGCLEDIPFDFNIVPVKMVNIEEVPRPWAIITPDGQWQAVGQPDWFGSSRIDDHDWGHTARNLIQQHLDKTLVVVECQS